MIWLILFNLKMELISFNHSVSIMDAQWKHPFSAIIAGPSGCGKSHFVTTFIEYIDKMCDVVFDNIFWHYAEWQLGNVMERVTFKEGLPNMSDYDGSKPNLIIIDDMMHESDSRVVDLFTKGCHHRNISVFFITQNLFHQGRGQRDISLNAHYIVCFKNPRDKAQIRHLAQQVFPENPKFIQEAYSDATQTPHGYLLLDMKQSTPDEIRFRTMIFPNDPHNYVYVPKKK